MKTHLINLDTKQKKVDLFVKVHHNENHEFAVLLLVSSAVAENCCFPRCFNGGKLLVCSSLCDAHNYAFYGNRLFTLLAATVES